jgi:hypothetical protein
MSNKSENAASNTIQIRSPISGSLVNVNADPFGVTVSDTANNNMDGTLTINGTGFSPSSVVRLTHTSPFKWLLKFSVTVTIASGTAIEMLADDGVTSRTANYTQK